MISNQKSKFKNQKSSGHPRLYMEASDLPKLRADRHAGIHALIWENMETSAAWCLEQKPRNAWIAPVEPDPIHENLYDRFYAIMSDLAITEHLAFTYALSGEAGYGRAARDWVLASCRVWRQEADGAVDGGKAYAVCRMLKGVAVGYDLIYDLLSEEERSEIREVLVRIGRMYYTDYFKTPEKMGPGFHTHHATVEFASFGVAALALLGEVSEVKDWMELTVEKFEQHLLPHGLAEDGAHIEGATFWTSTMQYRLFFMDALRRVTGYDLFSPYRDYMNVDFALAGIAGEKKPGYNTDHETVVLQPSYGQLDYCAPVLLGLAAVYQRPHYQYLALWDHALGCIQKTRFLTPNGEQLLFELGGYAYVWYNPEIPVEPDESRLSRHFKTVDEAYLRASWKSGDMVIGINAHNLVVHAGGKPVLICALRPEPETVLVQKVEDRGDKAIITCSDGGSITLHRPGRTVIRLPGTEDQVWDCQGNPVQSGNTLTWPSGVTVKVTSGEMIGWVPGVIQDAPVVGNGLLKLKDAAPFKISHATVQPGEENEICIEILNP